MASVSLERHWDGDCDVWEVSAYTRTGQSDWRGDKGGERPNTRQVLSKARAFSGGVKEEISHRFSPNYKRNALMALIITPECLLFYSTNCSIRLNLKYVRKTPISARASLLARVHSVTDVTRSLIPSNASRSRLLRPPSSPAYFTIYGSRNWPVPWFPDCSALVQTGLYP